jgi:hypothetical protein
MAPDFLLRIKYQVHNGPLLPLHNTRGVAPNTADGIAERGLVTATELHTGHPADWPKWQRHLRHHAQQHGTSE